MTPDQKKHPGTQPALGADTAPRLIPGYHAVREAMDSGAVKLEALWIAEGKTTPRLKAIAADADARGIPVRAVGRVELERLFPDVAHQGIAAVAEPFHYADLEALIRLSGKAHGYALLVAADHITDEGNLGSLIRTAAFFGAHGLIIPKDRSAGMSPAVLKRSSGAYVHLPVARVVNLGRAMARLAEEGFWIIGTSGDADDTVYEFDWRRDTVLVLGNERKGLSRAVTRLCHEVVRIPRQGKAESLNVAVAAGAVLSEIRRQHKGGQHKLT